MNHWKPEERFEIEARVYDRKAKELLEHLKEKDLYVNPNVFPFPNRESIDFTTYALTCLGDVSGKKILDCGCGTGGNSVFFAKKNAKVTGVDISKQNIRICQMRAKINNVEDRVKFLVSPIETLGYDDQYFDLIFGTYILHHVDREMACANLHRILKHGGKSVFCEPALFLDKRLYALRNTKLFKTLIPHHTETPTERSLSREDIQIFRNVFEKVEWKGFHILTRAGNWFNMSDGLYNKIQRFDTFVLRNFNFARSLCHHIVLKLE